MPSIMKLALPVLAAASAVSAQCSISGTTTLQNAGDATAMPSCATFSGNIAVATGTTDDISISNIGEIDGNFVASQNPKISRISMPDLQVLKGTLTLDTLQRLSNVDFPKLKNVTGITWNALPNLQQIGFTASVEQASNVRVENTGLRSLKGINIQQVKDLFLANNGYISSVDMQLNMVTGNLTLADNNKAVNVSLPNLQSAKNLEFRFCGSVSVPSLALVNGSLTLNNNGFDTFMAPNLTNIGAALAVVANDQLTNLTFPMLKKIGANMQIANNSALKTVDGFPQLESIKGAFDVSGNMSTIETPKLDDVSGALNIQSTENVTDACNFYQPLKDKKLIGGTFTCKGKLVDPGTNGHAATSQGSGKKGAASTLSASTGALGLAAMAAVFLL